MWCLAFVLPTYLFQLYLAYFTAQNTDWKNYASIQLKPHTLAVPYSMYMCAFSKVCESGASRYGLPVKVWGPLGKYGRLAQPSMPLVKYGSLSQWGGRCWASNLSSTRLDCPILLPHTRQSRFPSYFLSYFHCPILLPHQACTKL